MHITPVDSLNRKSFKRGTLNINVFSDTHGELLLSNKALEEMRTRQSDIFLPEVKGNSNMFAICGDWFMDGARKGFSEDKSKPLAFFQLDILNEFINQIKNIAPKVSVIFTPGNHEFDGGVQILDDTLSNLDSEILASNINIDESYGLKKTVSENKIINEKIVEIDDDKNPNIIHKVLLLGIVPVNMSAYQPETDGVVFTDNSSKIQKKVSKEDYVNTLELCKSKIQEFKDDNPNGAVICLCHTGVEFADNLAKESDVDLIFDAHEHKDNERMVNKTLIIPLSMNFKKIVNTKIKFNDNGENEGIDFKSFSPLNNNRKGILLKLYTKLFDEEIKPIYTIKGEDSDNKFIDMNGIRQGNNMLANFVTDSILTELRKTYADVDFFALNSSSIRHSLTISDKPSNSKFDIMNVLAGIREQDGRIYITELYGLDIAKLILDNFLFNKEDPQKNTIIQYSGLSIDRTSLLKSIENGEIIQNISNYIIDKNTGLPIEMNKIYKIANVEKYFDKNQNSDIRELKKISYLTEFNVHELFQSYINSEQDNLKVSKEERIK